MLPGLYFVLILIALMSSLLLMTLISSDLYVIIMAVLPLVTQNFSGWLLLIQKVMLIGVGGLFYELEHLLALLFVSAFFGW
jgi:hypothetical protein